MYVPLYLHICLGTLMTDDFSDKSRRVPRCSCVEDLKIFQTRWNFAKLILENMRIYVHTKARRDNGNGNEILE
jgi:hypothetical protein